MTAGSNPNDLERRKLTPSDAATLLTLSDEAGWNQTVDDWRLMLTLGEGIGYWQSERPVASALILPFDTDFAWLSMVLVTAAWRRRGLASALTESCLKRAQTLGLSLRLDATDAGRAVYRRFGFADQYTFTRYLAQSPRGGEAPTNPTISDDLTQAADFDAKVFGADRRKILANFADRRPSLARVLDCNGACTGIIFGRDGHRATHLGPLAADDAQGAIVLLAAAIRGAGGPLIIDAIDDRPAFAEHLADMGFVAQRQFTRMSLGGPALNAPDSSFAVAGPEYG